MRLAKQSDRNHVVDLLTESFKDNPTLKFLTRRGPGQKRRIRKVAQYAFDYAIRRNGVFLSDSGNGVAICYKYNLMKKDLIDLFNRAKLLFSSIALTRIITIISHQKRIEATRPTDGDYLYFWFLGVNPEKSNDGSARELVDGLFEVAEKLHLDIYSETTMKQNKVVYERFGFEIYHQFAEPEKRPMVWFMRRCTGG